MQSMNAIARSLPLALMVLLHQAQPAQAFWGLFESPPTATVTFDREKCPEGSGVKLLVRNESSEPLGKTKGIVKIYRPEVSSLLSDFTFGTDTVIKPGKGIYFCLNVPRMDIDNLMAAKWPGKFGSYEIIEYTRKPYAEMNWNALLSDAIFQFEVTEFEYGLPY